MNPLSMIRPGRKITGISAVLLPFTATGEIDWPAFDAHLARTATAGLTPAVNMDTGYVHLLDEASQDRVLTRTRDVLAGGRFVAGAFVIDQVGSAFDNDAYRRRIERIQGCGAMPVIFQSFGLTSLDPDRLIAAYAELAASCDAFIGFELGQMFAPFGAIYDLQTFGRLMAIPQCIGAKHSSLSRTLEWQRLALRDERRPDFKIFTGNDLAIDMVMYGSDYLLGLATLAPDVFALRDRHWQQRDERFYEVNDLLQYLGAFTFRAPVPAYKHSAAQFLKLRGWIDSDATHPASPRRPDSDREILATIARRLPELIA